MRLRRFGRVSGGENQRFHEADRSRSARGGGEGGEESGEHTTHMIAALFSRARMCGLNELGDGYFGEVCDMNAILHMRWDGKDVSSHDFRIDGDNFAFCKSVAYLSGAGGF